MTQTRQGTNWSSNACQVEYNPHQVDLLSSKVLPSHSATGPHQGKTANSLHA